MWERELKQKIERKKKGNFLFFQIREKHKKKNRKQRKRKKLEKKKKKSWTNQRKGIYSRVSYFFAKERVQSLDGKEGRDLHFFSREFIGWDTGGVLPIGCSRCVFVFWCVPLCNHSKCENWPPPSSSYRLFLLSLSSSMHYYTTHSPRPLCSSNWIRYSKSVVGL